MPSIAKSTLDDLNARVVAAEARSENERLEKIALRSKVAAFDSILDKVGRAANGMPLTDDRNINSWGVASNLYSPGVVDSRLTDAERQAADQERLRERIIALESRLAAVVAVAQFAKAHKS